MRLRRVVSALVHSNDRRFVSLLCDQADAAVEGLLLLQGTGDVAAVKEVERRADEIRRVLIAELMGTYATPFDREDLFALSRAIDDIVDTADEAARELASFAIRPPDLEEMAGVLVSGAEHVRLGVAALLDHPTVAAEHAVRAKRSENRIDDLYHAAVVRLFGSGAELPAMLGAREVYRHLKNSADRIDDAADEISMIAIKWS